MNTGYGIAKASGECPGMCFSSGRGCGTCILDTEYCEAFGINLYTKRYPSGDEECAQSYIDEPMICCVQNCPGQCFTNLEECKTIGSANMNTERYPPGDYYCAQKYSQTPVCCVHKCPEDSAVCSDNSQGRGEFLLGDAYCRQTTGHYNSKCYYLSSDTPTTQPVETCPGICTSENDCSKEAMYTSHYSKGDAYCKQSGNNICCSFPSQQGTTSQPATQESSTTTQQSSTQTSCSDACSSSGSFPSVYFGVCSALRPSQSSVSLPYAQTFGQANIIQKGGKGEYGCGPNEYCWCFGYQAPQNLGTDLSRLIQGYMSGSSGESYGMGGAVVPGTCPPFSFWSDEDALQNPPKEQQGNAICDKVSNATLIASLDKTLVEAGAKVTVEGTVNKISSTCKGYKYICRDYKHLGCEKGFWSIHCKDCPSGYEELACECSGLGIGAIILLGTGITIGGIGISSLLTPATPVLAPLPIPVMVAAPPVIAPHQAVAISVPEVAKAGIGITGAAIQLSSQLENNCPGICTSENDCSKEAMYTSHYSEGDAYCKQIGGNICCSFTSTPSPQSATQTPVSPATAYWQRFGQTLGTVGIQSAMALLMAGLGSAGGGGGGAAGGYTICAHKYVTECSAAPVCASSQYVGCPIGAFPCTYDCPEKDCGAYTSKDVKIEVIDENKHTVSTGTTRTDSEGRFSYTFNAPHADGLFTIKVSVPIEQHEDLLQGLEGLPENILDIIIGKL
ncbi:MAG: hypothetical protein ACTSV7_09000 [Candidatus Baldrarchaeia archaeon]